MKKNVLNLKMALLAFGILLSGAASAFTAVTSGNWSSAATWGGTAPGSTVTSADIIIPAGITVTLDADVVFTGLVNTFSVSGTLSSTSNNYVNITQGAVAGNGTISIHKIMFTNISTASFTGSMNVNEFVNSSLSLGFVAVANVSDSLILESGSLVLNTNSTLSMMANSTIRRGNGAFSLSGGTFGSSSNYNLIYSGTSKSSGIELNGTTVQNVYVKMSSNTESVTLSNNTTINSALNISTGMVNFSSRKLTLNGDLIMAAGTSFISSTASDLMIAGTGSLTSALAFSSNSSLNTFTINRPATVKLASALNIAGSLGLLTGTCSLESGANLTMASGSKVHVEAGAIAVNSGSFTGTAPYDVEYMGSTGTNGGVELSGAGLNNLTVNYTAGSAKVSINNNVVIAGAFNLTSGKIDLNGFNLTANGTFSQNSNGNIVGNPNSELNLNIASASTSTLYFDNASAANQTLSKLKLNIGGSASLMLATQLIIKNELGFIKGKIMIDNNDLVMLSSAAITGYDDTHYVVTTGTGAGTLKMNVAAGGSSFVTFPVGTNSNYSPAYVQQTSSATTGNIMVKAMNDVLGGGTTGYVNSNSMALVGRTWFVEAESGVTVNMNLKLGWVAAAEVNGFNRTAAMIRHYTNNAWDTYAVASATAGTYNTFELERTGITSLSPFAVADATAPLKVAEITNTVDFEMYPNPAKETVTLKLSAANGNYLYNITDISGRVIALNTKADDLTKIDVSAYQPGCYFIKITNKADNSTTTKRFIKN